MFFFVLIPHKWKKNFDTKFYADYLMQKICFLISSQLTEMEGVISRIPSNDWIIKNIFNWNDVFVESLELGFTVLPHPIFQIKSGLPCGILGNNVIFKIVVNILFSFFVFKVLKMFKNVSSKEHTRSY